MYHYEYISKKDPRVKTAYADIISLLKEVQHEVKDKFTFQFYVVGSYKRNMITCDFKSNVGFDFDFNIMVNDEDCEYSPKDIRDILRRALSKVAKKYGYDNAEDSTRVLTIKQKDTKKSRIKHSCDFCIVNDYFNEDGEHCQEYIHFLKNQKRYEWRNQGNGFYGLDEKFKWLKENGYDKDLREEYLILKNKNNDRDKHSRQLFAEAVNNVYNWD